MIRDLATAYVTGIAAASYLGVDRLAAELEQYDQELSSQLQVERSDIVTGAVLLLGPNRAMRAAQGAADSWRKSYQAAELAGESNPAWIAQQSANSSVSLGSAVETHEAFGAARRQAISLNAHRLGELDLIRVWNATLDKRTCPKCEKADGKWVEVYERFPWGEPGSVHPRCRCYDELVPRRWASPLDIAA